MDQLVIGYRHMVTGIGQDICNLNYNIEEQISNFNGLFNNNYRILSKSITGSPFYINDYKISFNTNRYILARAVQYLYDSNKYIISLYTNNTLVTYTYTYLIDITNPDWQYLFSVDNNDSPYKAVIDSLTGEMYYTVRKSNNFEDREIKLTTNFNVVKCNKPIFTIEKK